MDRQQKRRNELRRHISVMTLVFVGALMVFSFQNFAPRPDDLDLSLLKPEFPSAYARASALEQGTGDIRDIAPHDPRERLEPAFVAPESGTDLNSVGQDWLMRQTRALTGGAEQRLLDGVNKRMNRMMKFEPVEGDGYPDGTAKPNDPTPEGGADPGTDAGGTETSRSGFRPLALRLTAVNRLQMDLANRTQLSCSVEGAGVRLDLARPLSDRIDLNLRHVPSSNTSSVRLHYNW